ncbi:hypothetical protein DFQ27_005047 [Actinomortierella ambigua]|uniref:RRM domain-containing protein n=1 Tax=Actinomortierella ambigua TaxID=1343610 RepID=A0A9P6Q338_9FUNG|nr:hypothetical protein DFQ27_005047 [Actinomortierella ambigua]
MSSLYGDLPPPSTEASGSDSSKSENAAGAPSATISKPPLPAGWSASLNRLKPIPRRTQLPKPKQAQRSIPAGFMQHSETAIPTASAASPVSKSSTPTGAINTNSGPNVSSGGSPGTSAPVSEETNWLKAKAAQVQHRRKEREENASEAGGEKPADGTESILLAIAITLSVMDAFLSIQIEIEIEITFVFPVAISISISIKTQIQVQVQVKVEVQSRSRSQSPSSSRGRYGVRPQSPRRGRSPSPRGPSFRNAGPAYSGSRSQSRSRSRGRGRSQSPLFVEQRGHGRSPRRYVGSHSGSPPARRRSYSRSRSRSRSHSPPPPLHHPHRGLGAAQQIPSKRPHSPEHHGPTTAGNPSKYKAFAPPPSLSENSFARVEPAESTPIRPPIPQAPSASLAGIPSSNPSVAARIVMSDASGEDAYLRRMQMSQHRASAPSYSQSTAHPPPPAPAFVPASPQASNAPASRPPLPQEATSTVVLLTNMVGPGEVDEMLQDETAGECEKYGRVIRCLIFEVQKNRVPPEEAVRIFVKFESPAAAERALRDLNGRYFGGRQVRGQYFDEQRFDRLQLAP